ncbi:hypothetical protein HNR35_001037 [Borreliella spielmanii]|uniref:Uncharacterized protein n=1 Tax=Borreliella spielmanii TaxID=88916 RepID=A0ABR6P7N7_9SPIR|nr:hypothetical protein [Borreliella spielmanii]
MDVSLSLIVGDPEDKTLNDIKNMYSKFRSSH